MKGDSTETADRKNFATKKHPTEGRVWLHRSVMDSWVSERHDHFHAWCYMLMLANDKPRTINPAGVKIDLQRGQFLRAKSTMMSELRFKYSKLESFLERCVEDEMITLKLVLTVNARKKGYLFTILNYNAYNPALIENAPEAKEVVTVNAQEQGVEHPNETQKVNRNQESGNRKPISSNPPEILSEENVEAFCKLFEDKSRGISGIPESWWRGWYSVTVSLQKPLKNWRETLKQAFLCDFIIKHPKALGKSYGGQKGGIPSAEEF